MFGLAEKEYASILFDLTADRNVAALSKTIAAPSDAAMRALAVLAATGAGDVRTAFRIVETTPGGCADSALGRIARGNLDQTCGRLSDAFTEYEIGLQYAADEGREDLLWYGRIWRDLALARFGDHASLRDLEQIASDTRRRALPDLAALADAFRAAASVIVGRPVPDVTASIDGTRTPGLAALARAALILAGSAVDLPAFHSLVMRTEGMKGAPELIAAAVHETAAVALDGWITRHVVPIDALIAADDAAIFPSLPDAPAMAPMDCARCDGRCCYDGVYVTGAEEERIRAFMKLHPVPFAHIPDEFLEDGEWGFLFHGKRTIRVPHVFDRPDFPKHFTHTKCVFALPSGECSLQKAATENLCHPWKVKPELCWEFPLIGLFNDNAIDKPHYFGEPDPGFYDADHPGYLAFMPCSRTAADGKSWKRMYRTEFLHYFKTKGIKR